MPGRSTRQSNERQSSSTEIFERTTSSLRHPSKDQRCGEEGQQGEKAGHEGGLKVVLRDRCQTRGIHDQAESGPKPHGTEDQAEEEELAMDHPVHREGSYADDAEEGRDYTNPRL